MRAFVVNGPNAARVRDVPDPRPGPGDLVVEVERVGICGTDVEHFTGEMAYFEQGHTHFPITLGHEWTEGRVIEYVDHLHERFLDPVVIRDGRCRIPMAPGYSAAMRSVSIARYRYPGGSEWSAESENAGQTQRGASPR